MAFTQHSARLAGWLDAARKLARRFIIRTINKRFVEEQERPRMNNDVDVGRRNSPSSSSCCPSMRAHAYKSKYMVCLPSDSNEEARQQSKDEEEERKKQALMYT